MYSCSINQRSGPSFKLESWFLDVEPRMHLVLFWQSTGNITFFFKKHKDKNVLQLWITKNQRYLRFSSEQFNIVFHPLSDLPSESFSTLQSFTKPSGKFHPLFSTWAYLCVPQKFKSAFEREGTKLLDFFVSKTQKWKQFCLKSKSIISCSS